MKLRAYVVDDEPLAIDRLKRLLEQTGRVDVIGSTTEPEQAVIELSANLPDICFLDIEMPRMNAFAVLGRLPKQPAVIFTTAYDQYALQAFEVNSVDYLLKPIDPEHIDRALDKFEQLRNSPLHAPPDLQAIVEKLAASLRQPRPDYPTRIASRLGDRLWFLDLPRVTHFYAEDKLTYAMADGKAYCIDHTIAQLESKLNPNHFIRIHRSTLLNTAWIRDITSLPGGGLNVRLKDSTGTDLTVARDRSRDFKQRLDLD